VNRFVFLTLVLFLAEPMQAADTRKPMRVFILADQSNMEGQAVVDLAGKDYNAGRGTLAALLKNPGKAPLVKHLQRD
jgi:hypothetical protein